MKAQSCGFEPISGKGDYYVYYMPSKTKAGRITRGQLSRPLRTTHLKPGLKHKSNSSINTTVKEIQAIDSFNSFTRWKLLQPSRKNGIADQQKRA